MKTYLNLVEAADLASVSPMTIRRWVKGRYAGSLGIRVGGRWRIDPEALDTILRGEDPARTGEVAA